MTRSLIKQLVALKTSQELGAELRYNLDNLETSKGREPTMDHSTAVIRLTGTLEKLQEILRGSTSHDLRQSAREFDSRLTHLSVKEIAAPPTIMASASSSTTSHKTHHLPKMTLPTYLDGLDQFLGSNPGCCGQPARPDRLK